MVAGITAALVAAVIVQAVSGVAGIAIAAAVSSVTAVVVMIALDWRLGLGLRETLAEPFPWTRRLAGLWRVEP